MKLAEAVRQWVSAGVPIPFSVEGEEECGGRAVWMYVGGRRGPRGPGKEFSLWDIVNLSTTDTDHHQSLTLCAQFGGEGEAKAKGDI